MDFYYDAVDKDVLILSADGGLMAENTDEFVGQLEHYLELGMRKMIVDCTRLSKITSAGLGTLVMLHKRLAKKGGDVKLACVSGFVGRVIEMTRLGVILHVYPTVLDARRAFGGEPDGEPGDSDVKASRHPLLD